MPGKLRGIQKDVIHFYRQCIRAALRKPRNKQQHFVTYIHEEFDKYRDLPRKDFGTIEYLLRAGDKKLKMYSRPELTDIH
ncbi:Sdh6p NDAI_0A04460 [Naumovozyma dairenensis CBS 421]|uniref:Complex 1 LYR protein domain-containing protein n=1 Tax=Naumovozyma dairenensis (strain ATCC 10597 / BCRC 20456 / CBS 421 / NBRC 0211 / NRRL Y-12639) TaxID=1071378 RepID=G0W464_NAUDC|nr:hypothetical protein NDAI_0A04460 [Naumovozyma dairenensis CBS 421]CCD22602.1 hypothetical protein NDAI_0A04460 [Naumovozyma dairenensis CBS 421]